ncbi:MAG: hypothetical protein KAV87_31495 [Desulfobacteraceae bacterium]|nr:hypothetical protein [Desulfobacteraceae bacterium]
MRKKPSPNLKKKVFAFYGTGCVVRGATNENMLDLAHIDDNSENTIFENLLPLSKDLNGACQDSKGQRKPDLPEELFPPQLAIRAWTHFRDGQFAASYGCHRLAAHLSLTRFNDISHCLECLISCIAALRPIANPDLLRHTILLIPNVIDVSKEKVHPLWKGEYLSQLGLVLYDYQQSELAKSCHKLAEVFYSKFTDSPWKRQTELKKAAGERRYALVIYNNKTLDKLKELIETFRQRGDYTGEATTLHVKAILEFEHGYIHKAKDSLSAMLKIKSKTGNRWVVAELHLLLGRIYIALGEKKKAISEFETSEKLFQEHQIIPEPSLSSGPLDPSVELQKLGRSARPLPGRDMFPLSINELKFVVNRIRNSP